MAWARERLLPLLAAALLLSQPCLCGQAAAAFVQQPSCLQTPSSAAAAAATNVRHRKHCLASSQQPDFESDTEAYPTMEQQLAAMRPAPPPRRPVRRVLSLNDLDSGFKGFEDELEEQQRTLQQRLLAQAASDNDNSGAAGAADSDDDGGPPRLIPDADFKWYVLQVYTASELFSQKIIQTKLEDWGVADRVRQVVVPVRKVPQTVGKRLRVKEVPLYQGYVYCEVMMDERLRDLIGGLPRVVGFVGQKRDENNVRIPDPMRAAEVERILANMRSGDARPAVLDEFSIGDMVQILSGTYAGETGALRLVRSDELVVRLYSFNTQIDVGLPFDAVRKLSEEEILAENAAAEAAKSGGYRDSARAQQGERMLREQRPPRAPRAYDDFSDAPRLQLSAREERRERAWKKGRDGAPLPPVAARMPMGGLGLGRREAGPGQQQRPQRRGGLEFGDSDISFMGEGGEGQQQRGGAFDDRGPRMRSPRPPPPPRGGGRDVEPPLFFDDLDSLAEPTVGGRADPWSAANDPLDVGVDVDPGQDDFFAALMEELKAPPPEPAPRRPAAAGGAGGIGAVRGKPAAAQRSRAAQEELALDLDLLMPPQRSGGGGGGGGGDDLFGPDSGLGAFTDDDLLPPAPPRARAAAGRGSMAGGGGGGGGDAFVDDGELDALLAELEAAAPALERLERATKLDAGPPATDTRPEDAFLLEDGAAGGLLEPPEPRAYQRRGARAAAKAAAADPPGDAFMDELDSLLASLEAAEGGVNGLDGASLDAAFGDGDGALPPPPPKAKRAAVPAKRAATAAEAAPVASAPVVGGGGGGGEAAAVRAMKVPELKEALKARGLKVGGKKDELVERLISDMQG